MRAIAVEPELESDPLDPTALVPRTGKFLLEEQPDLDP
jgi:hypothetical protein